MFAPPADQPLGVAKMPGETERHLDWPRPGHVGELHEWAKEVDAFNNKVRDERMVAIREGLISLVGEEALQVQAGKLIDALVVLSGQPKSNMIAMYNGEAMNA